MIRAGSRIIFLALDKGAKLMDHGIQDLYCWETHAGMPTAAQCLAVDRQSLPVGSWEVGSKHLFDPGLYCSG
jgi:hypothetical protein